MRKLRSSTVIAALLVLVLFLAACGNGGAAPATPTPAAPTPAPPAAGGETPPEAEVLEVSDIAGSLTIYTSMKESKMGDIVRAFNVQYPNISVEHYSAGAGRLMARIAAEREAGQIQADLLWHSEVPVFYGLAADGILHEFIPTARANDEILCILVEPSPYFTTARLGALGIIYNTNHIDTPPVYWNDLLAPEWADGFAIANPSLSGTALIAVAMFGEYRGDEFFRDLRANGAMVGGGSGQVVDDTASGEYFGALAVDYIVYDVMDLGATVGMAWPRDGAIVIPSPVGIFRESPNIPAAEIFLEFLLGPVGQQIIADNATTPVRPGMIVPERFNLPTVEEMVAQGMRIDFVAMTDEREAIINNFLDIMQS